MMLNTDKNGESGFVPTRDVNLSKKKKTGTESNGVANAVSGTNIYIGRVFKRNGAGRAG